MQASPLGRAAKTLRFPKTSVWPFKSLILDYALEYPGT